MARPIEKSPKTNITDEVVSIMEKEDKNFNHYICSLLKLDQNTLEQLSLGIAPGSST